MAGGDAPPLPHGPPPPHWLLRRPAPKFLRSKHFMTACYSLALFVDAAAFGIVIPILPNLTVEGVDGEVPLSETDVGGLFAAYAAGYLAPSPFVGFFSDKYRVRVVPMCLGLVALAGSSVLFGTASGLPALYAARVLQGISCAATWTVAVAALADVFTSDELSGPSSIGKACNTIGFLVGPVMGGGAYQMAGQLAPFAILAGLVGLDLLLWLLLDLEGAKRDAAVERHRRRSRKKPPRERESEGALPSETIQMLGKGSRTKEDEERAASEDGDSVLSDDLALVASPDDEPVSAVAILKLWLRPEALLIFFSSMLCSMQFATIESAGSVELTNSFDMTPAAVGAVFTALFLPNALAGLLMGFILDAFPRSLVRRLISALGLVFFGASFWLLNTVRPPTSGYLMALPAAVLGTAEAVSDLPIYAEIAAIADAHGPGTGYGTLYSAWNLFYGVGILVGPVAAGFAVQQRGFEFMVWVIGGVTAAFGLVAASGFTVLPEANPKIQDGADGAERELER
ncbi:major facilitator superfamily domain-containing protein [Hyaloraphidium curvatum]|nr:major facilitator superfamily domain-containing protein [Hyaloraphidium curvatum]